MSPCHRRSAMVSVDQPRVETVETLKDSICARNTFQSLFALLLSLSKACTASWSSPRLFHLPHFIAKGERSSENLPLPSLHQPSPAEPCSPAVSTLHCWAPQTLARVPGASVGSLPLHLPTEPHRPPAPQTRVPPHWRGGSSRC